MRVSNRLALFNIVATLAYLGLAILGGGGFSAFFSHPPLVFLTIVFLIMSGVGLFSRGNLSSVEREDRGNRWVLPVFALIGVLSAWLPAYADRIGILTFGGDTMRWLGVILFVIGGVLRLWPVFILGLRFSGLVVIQPGHSLVTGGMYGVIRHPSYLGMMINAVGWALAFRSGVGVMLAVLLLVPLIARIRAEEALLHSQFGAEYDAYCARTARLIPGLY
ncbi:putative transmembrane protein [Collimonas arenae]|uniref:Putative transmembrane protein n=1 Tax=Collimonas arenae TaxID=279058 RepID=A0A0A1F9A9_9BURK|nr:isoprenylcysteine carboxylmethyltransferase family protein [Collimonas arenae]AIY41121.1 putative transmembrane protein [Collimonas arenae]